MLALFARLGATTVGDDEPVAEVRGTRPPLAALHLGRPHQASAPPKSSLAILVRSLPNAGGEFFFISATKQLPTRLPDHRRFSPLPCPSRRLIMEDNRG